MLSYILESTLKITRGNGSLLTYINSAPMVGAGFGLSLDDRFENGRGTRRIVRRISEKCHEEVCVGKSLCIGSSRWCG